jgi:hypothetical protein
MEQEVQGTASAEKLVEVYIKIRDASEANYRSYMDKKADLEAQLDVIQAELLDILKTIDATSLKTSHGLARRSVKQRYTTNDWERFHLYFIFFVRDVRLKLLVLRCVFPLISLSFQEAAVIK